MHAVIEIIINARLTGRLHLSKFYLSKSRTTPFVKILHSIYRLLLTCQNHGLLHLCHTVYMTMYMYVSGVSLFAVKLLYYFIITLLLASPIHISRLASEVFHVFTSVQVFIECHWLACISSPVTLLETNTRLVDDIGHGFSYIL